MKWKVDLEGKCGGMLRVNKMIVQKYMVGSKQIHLIIAGRDLGSTGNRKCIELS